MWISYKENGIRKYQYMYRFVDMFEVKEIDKDAYECDCPVCDGTGHYEYSNKVCNYCKGMGYNDVRETEIDLRRRLKDETDDFRKQAFTILLKALYDQKKQGIPQFQYLPVTKEEIEGNI